MLCLAAYTRTDTTRPSGTPDRPDTSEREAMAGKVLRHETLQLAGQPRAVELRTHPKARRLILRLGRDGESLRVTLPPGVPAQQGLAFAARHEGWLRRRLAAQPERVPFTPAQTIPVRDVAHVIRHRPEARRGVWLADGEINVSGAAEHVPRRVRDVLIAEARRDIVPQARDLAARLGRDPGRITLRDTRSRWGSCSAKGHLNFCWRLIFAPDWVLTYVVAHEVAHLEHLDHSAAYWRCLRTLTDDVETPRRWLNANALRLQRYG